MTLPPWETLDDAAFRAALRLWLRDHLAMTFL